MIIAHLGNGASVTAVKGGKSIDTSMGLTPSGGVIMGTRSGDLDPGVLVYLMREKKFDANRIEALVDHRSGLLGISGVSCDMRRLHDVASSNADARLAIQMFCYSVRKQVVAMIAALGGVDLIVFTGGIGENDGEVRASILSWAGVSLNESWSRSANNPTGDPALGVPSASPRLARRRADRPPYLGIVTKEPLLMAADRRLSLLLGQDFTTRQASLKNAPPEDIDKIMQVSEESARLLR